MKWFWPLPGIPKNVPRQGEEGSFGLQRRHDIHTGVDLYCSEGQPVHAVEEGVIIRIENFTGPEAGYPWWLPTRAILVEGSSGVVCYGELEESGSVAVGDSVHRGKLLGYVKRVIPKDKPDGRVSMLHFELYQKGFRGKTAEGNLGEPFPEELLDPTDFLVSSESNHHG